MKIVFLSGLYPPHTKGGGEISAYLIAEGLKARGHEVEVITEENSHLGLLKKPLFERRHSRGVAAKLKRILPQVDIIHAHDFRSALALSELNLPNSVVTVRDYAPICGTTNNILADGSRCHCTWHDVVRTKRFQEVMFPRNMARAWQYWHNVPYRKEAYRKLKRQIFISSAQQKEIAEQFDFSGIETAVIYNPISEEYLSGPFQVGKPGSVFYVGRVEDYKGVRLLLAAWKEIAREFPHANLTVVGEGAQRTEYEQWVKENGLGKRIAFRGRVPYEQLREVYDAAQIVVAPHVWTEPFGRTVAEAMARSKIVVAADSGGPAEFTSGILFNWNSVKALRWALHRALTLQPERYQEMSHAAREWVVQNLTVRKIAQQYEEFYLRMRERT